MADARTCAAVVIDGHPPTRLKRAAPVPFVRHPVPVALAASACAAVAVVTSPPGAKAVLAAFLAAVLVVLAATDLERRIIPNRVVLPATVIALVANVAISPSGSPEFIVAALALGVAFLLPNLINASLMGMGDVKLMILLGAGLAWGAVGAVMIAFVAVFPFALTTLIRGGVSARKTTVPFGPFLALGGLVILIVPHLIGG